MSDLALEHLMAGLVGLLCFCVVMDSNGVRARYMGRVPAMGWLLAILSGAWCALNMMLATLAMLGR